MAVVEQAQVDERLMPRPLRRGGRKDDVVRAAQKDEGGQRDPQRQRASYAASSAEPKPISRGSFAA